MSGQSQNKTVLQHINKHGFITSLQAMQQYHILRLAARIHDLRMAGNSIEARMIGDGIGKYAEYRIVEKQHKSLA